MNNQELQKLTESIVINEFNQPFQHQAFFNNRLRTTGGRYMLESHHIEINPKQYETYGKQALIDIIKHELCHYFLHIEGKGYQHKDQDFKLLAEKVKAPRFCQPIKSYQSRVKYEYQCLSCQTTFQRIRSVNIEKMRCGKCGGRLKLLRQLR